MGFLNLVSSPGLNVVKVKARFGQIGTGLAKTRFGQVGDQLSQVKVQVGKDQDQEIDNIKSLAY